MTFKKGNKINLGRKLSEEHKRKISISNKGKTYSDEARKNMSNSRLKMKKRFGYINSFETRKKIGLAQLGEKNNNWKENKVGYVGLHTWVKRRKNKPKFCEKCRKEKEVELANISGKYKRDINDFKWLCKSCHTKFDFETGIRKVTNKARLNMSLAHKK